MEPTVQSEQRLYCETGSQDVVRAGCRVRNVAARFSPHPSQQHFKHSGLTDVFTSVFRLIYYGLWWVLICGSVRLSQTVEQQSPQLTLLVPHRLIQCPGKKEKRKSSWKFVCVPINQQKEPGWQFPPALSLPRGRQKTLQFFTSVWRRRLLVKTVIKIHLTESFRSVGATTDAFRSSSRWFHSPSPSLPSATEQVRP